jgi:folate-dependent phosphoribosylglycinamide formyltransferase PurN
MTASEERRQMKLVILSRRGRGEAVAALARSAGYEAKAVQDLAGLDGDILIGFSTGVIVPSKILERFDLAINFHGGTPEYPGRDPHYWAIHDDAETFGCTCHFMSERVDEGQIINVSRFPRDGMGAEELRLSAQVLMIAQFVELLPQIGNLQPTEVKWSGVKRSRSDFLDAGLKFESDENAVEEVMWREMERNYAIKELSRLNNVVGDAGVGEYLAARIDANMG